MKTYILNTRGFFTEHPLKNSHEAPHDVRVRENTQKRSSNVIVKRSPLHFMSFMAKNLRCKLSSVQIIICESRERKYSRFGAEIKDLYLSLASCFKTTHQHVRAKYLLLLSWHPAHAQTLFSPVPSRCFWDERRLDTRVDWGARGVMGRDEGKIATWDCITSRSCLVRFYCVVSTTLRTLNWCLK